ncbi:MAG: DUF6263 family protein [Gemmatimonadota bacterium]|nr:DUF6263 family protein [Gemmatimonadota bacterium]
MSSRTLRAVVLAAVPLVAAASLSAQSVLLRLAPEAGLESRYRMDMTMYMDNPMVSSDEPFMISTIETTQTVVGVEGDVVEYSMRTDAVDMQTPAMPALQQQIPDVTGQVQVMKMDTRGRMVSVDTGDPAVDEQTQQAIGQLGGMGLELPEQPVSPGESWQATLDFSPQGMPGGAGMTMQMQMTYTLTGVSSSGGSQLATISYEGPITMSGEGSASGMSASGRTSGSIVFDVTVGRIRTSEMEMSLDMNAMGMAIKMNQSMTMTLID